jgi:hypothetical protein
MDTLDSALAVVKQQLGRADTLRDDR